MKKKNLKKSSHIRFVKYVTTKNGRRIYASHYGKKAFPIH